LTPPKETSVEVIKGSVTENGNGAKPPAGGGKPAAGEKPRGAAKPEKNVRGRKDAEQEAVPDAVVLKEGLPAVIKSILAADEAKKQANDKVKALAKKSGFLASVVKKVAKAKAGEGFEEAHRVAEQLELAFSEVAKPAH
jgi:hypothetical protein